MDKGLERYIPPKFANKRVNIDESMSLVVERISQYLPEEQVWQHFSSSPSETGGIRRFPRCRVDAELDICRDYLWMIENGKPKRGETKKEFFCRNYEESSKSAMKVILWVEVGFEGLDNLAVHPASRNWTSCGHFVNDEQRAQRIITTERRFYDSVMSQFVDFRRVRGITEDCITKIGLEPVLERWKLVT